jgi:hypothetical protein
MFKNAVRICVTATLAAFVDRAFIDGPFHHVYGGVIFAPLDCVLFIPFLIGLRKLEHKFAGILDRSWRQPQAPMSEAAAPESLLR